MSDVNLGTVYTKIDLDTELLNQRVEEVLAAWSSIQQGAAQSSAGISGKMVDGLNQYQQRLGIIADKLERQRQLIEELERVSSKTVVGKNTAAEVEKATAQLEKEKIKLKELEAQFDRTYDAQRDFIAQQDKTAKKTAEVAKKMDLREAGANAKVGTQMAASGLRTIDQVAPGLCRNIDDIITQINATRSAMDSAAGGGMKFAMGLSGALGIATTLIMAGINQIQKSEEERQRAFEEGVQKTKEYAESLNTLETNLRILQDEKSTTDEVRAAREQLASTFPDLIVAYDDEGKAILANTELMEDQITALRAKQELARLDIVDGGRDVLKNIRQEKKDIDGLVATIEDGKKRMAHPTDPALTSEDLAQGVEGLERLLERRNIEMEADKKGVVDYYNALLRGAIKVADANGNLTGTWQDMTKAQQLMFGEFALSAENLDKFISGEETAEDAAARLMERLNDPSALEAYNAQLESSAAAAEKLSQKYNSQIEELSQLESAYQTLAKGQALSTGQLYQMAQEYPEIAKYLAETGDMTLQNGEIALEAARKRQEAHIQELENNRQDAESMRERTDVVIEGIEAEIEALQALMLARGATLYDVQSDGSMQAMQAKLDAQKKLQQEQQESLDKANAMLAAAKDAQKKLGETEPDRKTSSGGSGGSDRNAALAEELKQMERRKKLNQLTYQEELDWLKQLQSKYKTNADERADLEYRVYAAEQSLIKEAQQAVTARYSAELAAIDQKKRMGELTAAEEIAQLQEVAKIAGLTAEQKGNLDYRIYSAQKQMEQDAQRAATERLNAEYKKIDQQRRLGQLSGEEELAWLERIQRTFRMNADERVEMEIKLYNLKKELHQQDVEALNSLGGAVTEALRNQYEEQRKAEEDRVNESIESWRQWEKDTVSAIQGQIDALDELEQQQDSADKRAEYERKKQALTLQAAYEKDDYQRKQYQQELARLEAEEQKRLDAEAREEERKKLQQQIQEAHDEADKQEDALDKDLESIKQKYDELTKDFALRAEAEKAIMNSTQQEIVALIQSFAPEYDLAGQSLGDKLAEGFKAKFGSVLSYVEDVTKKIQDYQDTLIAQANAATDRYWAAQGKGGSRSSAFAAPAPVTRNTEINTSIQINQPVKSPVEVRRAIQTVADELARQIG